MTDDSSLAPPAPDGRDLARRIAAGVEMALSDQPPAVMAECIAFLLCDVLTDSDQDGGATMNYILDRVAVVQREHQELTRGMVGGPVGHA